MTTPIHIISLGAGVQSSRVALGAALDEITPPPLAAVFADTQDEPNSVYAYLAQLSPILPFPIHKVTAGKLSDKATTVRVSKQTGKTYIKHGLPVFMLRANGKRGMMQRHCTLDFKIEPIRKFLRDEIVGRENYLAWRRKHRSALTALADAKKKKLPCPFAAWQEMQQDALVCLWIGISVDEIERAKDSVVPWIVNRHPLLEMGESRQDCLDWCEKNNLPKPPKSSCAFCPYHNDDEWIRLRDQEPEAFQAAVEFEKRYTESVKQCPRLDGIPFLHDSLKPLSEVQFIRGRKRNAEQKPCEGICGI